MRNTDEKNKNDPNETCNDASKNDPKLQNSNLKIYLIHSLITKLKNCEASQNQNFPGPD